MKKEFRSGCPISSTLDVVGDKWSLLIIRDMLIKHKKTFKEKILALIESELEQQEIFVVEIEIKPDNHIMLYLDSMTGVSIDQIVFFSREINSKLDREIEDFFLFNEVE